MEFLVTGLHCENQMHSRGLDQLKYIFIDEKLKCVPLEHEVVVK